MALAVAPPGTDALRLRSAAESDVYRLLKHFHDETANKAVNFTHFATVWRRLGFSGIHYAVVTPADRPHVINAFVDVACQLLNPNLPMMVAGVLK